MAVDDQATEKNKAYAAMVLTRFSRNFWATISDILMPKLTTDFVLARAARHLASNNVV